MILIIAGVLVAFIVYLMFGVQTVMLCGDSLRESFKREGFENTWMMGKRGFLLLCLLFPILLFYMVKNSLKD